MSSDNRDTSGVIPGVMGATIAVTLCSFGAAYGTAKAGTGIAAMAIMRPDLVMKSIVPVVMAGIIGIYGLVVSVLLIGKINPTSFNSFEGYMTLGAGLSVGLAGVASGFAIGVVGECCVRAVSQQPKLFIGMILILIFAEVLALYGLITSIYLYTNF